MSESWSVQAPVNVDAFQRELDLLTRDRAMELRIKWAPSLERSRLEINNETRIFKKYPSSRDFQVRLKGFSFRRDNRTVGYQKLGGIIPPGVKTTDVAVPDYLYIQSAIEIFVIEQKMADAPARRAHAQVRNLCIETTGIDGFGDFPREGWWEWFDDVSEHKNECCAAGSQLLADARYILQEAVRAEDRFAIAQAEERVAEMEAANVPDNNCRGRYREPDARDLDKVAQSLWFRDQLPHLRNLDQPPSQREIDQYVKAHTDAVQDWERKYRESEIKRIGEDIAFALKPSMTPSVYVDLRKVKENATTGSA